MWTNVFKIGGLQHLSWFQLLPQESDLSPLPDKRSSSDHYDTDRLLVLSSHLQLQKEGFLSTWTNSFVGPWDPSQGLHNPDDKIKLWLFIPGHHSFIVETAQSAVSKLRVVASGTWIAPGGSEEVSIALSQSLRNCIERALVGLSYVRFGEAFSRYHPFPPNEESFRRGQPTIEFIFAATEDGIFVHAIITAKHIRAVCSDDIEKASRHSSSDLNDSVQVVVSPHGMRGRLTGYCPSDLVQEVYFNSAQFKTSNRLVGLPFQASQHHACNLRGKNCFVEVTLGFNGLQKASYKLNNDKSSHRRLEPNPVRNGVMNGSVNHDFCCERTFIYPVEAVVIPVLQTSLARSSLKRVWLQNWIGPSLSAPSFFLPSSGKMEYFDGFDIASHKLGLDSSNNSDDSSISSLSYSSSDTDHKMTTVTGELEADADSLTGPHYGLLTSDRTMGSKLLTGQKNSNGQLSEGINIPAQNVLNYSYGAEGNSVRSQWGWDHDDENETDAGMDIQILISEFGDFGDFFETNVLPFDEPPGTEEPQDLVVSAPDCGDVVSSPGVGIIDYSEQMLLPVVFPSSDGLIALPNAMEETLSRNNECTDIVPLPGPVDVTPAPLSGEFDYIAKAEALLTFAPEYGAIQTQISETSLPLFGDPYLPVSRKVESPSSSSNSYVYNATPPFSTASPSTCLPETPGASKERLGKHGPGAAPYSKTRYTLVGSEKEQHTKRLPTKRTNSASYEGLVMSTYSFRAKNADSSRKQNGDRTLGTKSPLSVKNVLATELECIMYQSSMCRTRHTLLNSCAASSSSFIRSAEAAGPSNHFAGEPSSVADNICTKYGAKQTDSMPHRLGHAFEGISDGPLSAPVGVWRTVGVAKGGKSSNSPSVDMCPSLPHKSFNEEGMFNQRQPLQELLDGMALLVQQATSLVDVTLDADCGDGPYGWLASQEQLRHGFSCGPSMVHAACGGSLASCHSMDAAGVELTDPLSLDVHASSVISLLQSDIKVALKSAFGILEGPLSITDWCRGSNQFAEAGTPVGEPISPSLSSGSGSSSLKGSTNMDVNRADENKQRRSSTEIGSLELDHHMGSRAKATLLVLPLPSILVGYQDDWLKTSVNSLQLWEKAPLEPYATQKHMNYHVICPDINPLTSAAIDFFQQLGTVYESCKLGSHSPLPFGNQMEIDSGKLGSSGFVLLDCPRSMKIESSNATLVGSVSDYFLSLSNGWDLPNFLKSLSKVLKGLKIDFSSNPNAKDTSNRSCMVIYIVCPFPEPAAILQTVVESSVAAGSVIFSSDMDRKSMLYTQVGKALNGSLVTDEVSSSNILTISGFSVSKLVLQIVSVDTIFRVTHPAYSELAILKEMAFTVYNKARRISRGSSVDGLHSSYLTGRSQSQSIMMPMNSPISGMGKDCVGSRMAGSSVPREGEWDSSWQTARSGCPSYDSNRMGEYFMQDEPRYMFEPLFILAEPGSIDHGVSPTMLNMSSDKLFPGDSGGVSSSGSVDNMPNSQHHGSDTPDGYGSDHQKSAPCIHCCYGWTEDWRWLVCIWTDSRGELLDSHVFPFGGISSRQDTKGLQCLFMQVLQQGCLILQACTSLDTAAARPRDFIISRIGCFYELECQEWQKAICSYGGPDVKKWPLQLRRPLTDGMPVSSNGPSLQQQEIGLIHDRTLPSSPSSMYMPQTKPSGYIKAGLGQPSSRKQIMGGHTAADGTRGLLHWIKSISFIALSVDHTLQLVSQADSVSQGGTLTVHSSSTSSYLEGFTPVKSLGSTPASYIVIPSCSMRFLPAQPLQLPTCLTAESPPLAHLLHSKCTAIPLTTGFVVSKAVPSLRRDSRSNSKEEWPSVLSVSLIDYYGGKHSTQEKATRAGPIKQGDRASSNGDTKDSGVETRVILESIAAELHALSWMTASPTYLERRTALPFHCDMVLRLRRLLHFADKELSSHPERLQTQ
uniref:Mediator of RNA polymerase II transcription subunit 13 n=1 Tax=Kalanchoe fedtschenkoi TaxID=63787 RepID=A0A7N0TH47_KALFE